MLITVLQKTGAVNWAEKLALKGINKLEDLKTYQQYPTGRNGA